MSNLFDKWRKENDKRQDHYLEPVSFRIWYQWGLESYLDDMDTVLQCISKWQTGFYGRWVYLLSKKMNRPKYEVKEKYIDPFIAQKVIHRDGSRVHYRAQIRNILRVYEVESLGGHSIV